MAEFNKGNCTANISEFITMKLKFKGNTGFAIRRMWAEVARYDELI